MPHYKDGTEAKIGDVVKGKGYNVKDKDGNLKEIYGIVVGVTPSAVSCNIKVAHLISGESAWKDRDGQEKRSLIHDSIHLGDSAVGDSAVMVNTEYGECAHFEKIA